MFKTVMHSATTNLPEGAPNPLASSLARDLLLVYARRIFHAPPISDLEDGSPRASKVDKFYRTQLVPLLNNLRSLHPRHLPCLLLLGCVYHAIGDFAESLAINDELLAIDANFVSDLPYSFVVEEVSFYSTSKQVEALSNKGTTLQSMGEIQQAIDCWWKSVYMRPTYWDAVVSI